MHARVPQVPAGRQRDPVQPPHLEEAAPGAGEQFLVAQEELEDAVENVQVDLAENGAIAVEKMASGTYDIILMDVQMPVMNGYEATGKIRALSNGKSKIPIIAMTANVMKEEVERCYEAGMDDFVGKPFDTGELLRKMHALLTTSADK